MHHHMALILLSSDHSVLVACTVSYCILLNAFIDKYVTHSGNNLIKRATLLIFNILDSDVSLVILFWLLIQRVNIVSGSLSVAHLHLALVLLLLIHLFHF